MIDHIRLDRPGIALQVVREGVFGAGTVRAVICESDDRRMYANDLALMLGFDGFMLRNLDGDTWIPAEK